METKKQSTKIKMTNLIGEYSVVEIPTNVVKIELVQNNLIAMWNSVQVDNDAYDNPATIVLPGNYELIGISSEMSESDLMDIVEKKEDDYEDFNFKDYIDADDQDVWFSDIQQSFQSLLTSKGLKGRYAILKQLK